MSNINGCFLHNSDEWSTPKDFFDSLNNEFHFTLDPCASIDNFLRTCSEKNLQRQAIARPDSVDLLSLFYVRLHA